MNTVGGLFSTVAAPPQPTSLVPTQGGEPADELPIEPPLLSLLLHLMFHQLHLLHRRPLLPYLPWTPSEETTPAKETIRVDVPSQTTHEAATDPSSPSESPAT
ncbi:hypothetical protein AAG906_025660 [Vitis piasezkii]